MTEATRPPCANCGSPNGGFQDSDLCLKCYATTRPHPGWESAVATVFGDKNGAKPQQPLPDSLVVKASDVKSRSIHWGWRGWVALGYLGVTTGEEGLGKGVFAAWLLAQATRGRLEGEWHDNPVNALVIASEDGIEDTWKPRLDLAGADSARVGFLNLDELSPDWNLRDGIEAVRVAVNAFDAGFVYVDAAMDHMPPPTSGESVNSPTFARKALGPLRSLVRERDIAACFSMHPPKARSGNYRDLVQASQAFTAIPRIGWLLARHPDDDPSDDDCRRVLVRGKGNIGRNPGSLEFRVVGRDYLHDDGRTTEREVVVGVGPSTVTLSDLMPSRTFGERPAKTKADRAAEIITRELADRNWHDARPIRALLDREGLNNNKTVADAKLKVKGFDYRQRDGVAHGGWEWRIASNSDPSSNSETLTPPARATLVPEVTLTPKDDGSSMDTVRVTELRPTNAPDSGASQSYSDNGLRAREAAADCSYPDRHRSAHRPHPETGRITCPVCHPSPEGL